MSIKIYKDDAANSIFIEDANGAQFLNSLQATVPVDKVTIKDLARQIDIVSNANHSDFIDKDGNSYSGSAVDVCNQLNAIFASSGTPTNEVPEITSPLMISLVQGETLNYELIANYGVAYEWDLSNVPGVANVNGNLRKLIGGSSLSAGTYNIPVKAINYNGDDDETIVLTVSTPPFSNTKSINFSNQDYLGANASLLSGILGRTGNGSGASDAWSISFWFKGGTSSNNSQTILYFGDNDVSNGGHLYIRYLGGNDKIEFRYGSNNNMLIWESSNNATPQNTWKHIFVSYDGGTTGSSSGSINDYYSRFNIFIDGINVVNNGVWGNSNFGWSSGIDADNLRIGRYNNQNYMRNNCRVDELAFFDSDQSSNISDIYNGGTPFNFSTLATPPKHWSRMGDGDTYPLLQDSGTEANLVWQMYGMTSADIVNDVP